MDRQCPAVIGRKLVATLVAAIIAIPAAALAATPVKRAVSANASKVHKIQLIGGAPEIEVFVRLDEPAVAELNAASLEQSGAFASPAAQKEQAAKVSSQQAAFKPTLQSHGARILSSQRVGANGFRARVRATEISAIRALPGVRSVAPVEKHRASNIDSVPWIGAPAVWSSVGKGDGVKIGIIDTGIDYLHANFGGSGNPATFAANNPNLIEPGTFPTAKVKGGTDLAGADYNADDPDSVPVPDPDPLDESGHGSHVAGTAAGFGVNGKIGPGVAPNANLYAIKVFGDGEGTTNLTSLGIEWAMDPNGDGDMSDHLDVINMSLGGAFGEPDDPSAVSASNAAALGIIVVASAGNENAVPYVIGSPSVSTKTISVAATVPGGRKWATLSASAPSTVAGSYYSIEGDGPVKFAQTGAISGTLVPSNPANGCTAYGNASAVATGGIAFVIRGACDFKVKYTNAQNAGAKAIVVYNDGADPTREEPLVMGGLDATIHIPGLMISNDDGLKLRAAMPVTASINVILDPRHDDRITEFSSEGPSTDNQGFKPDLAAPGESIVSTATGTGTEGVSFSGTSMAAPHVSGAAALLHQEHPNLAPGAIKALLQNSTVNANSGGDTRLTRQGTGVLRVDRAAALTSYAAPGGVSFGRVNTLLPVQLSETVTVTNLANSSRTYSVTHVANHTLPGVQVTCPGSVSVRGKRSETARIKLQFNPLVSANQGQSDDAFQSQKEIDGWCVFDDGKDQLRVGYIAVVDPASSVFVAPGPGLHSVDVHNLGPAGGWVEGFTLAKLGGEDLNHTNNSIAAVGFRRADPNFYLGQSVVELGVATERAFNHPSSLIYELELDTNNDGKDDVDLLALDESLLIPGTDPGTFVTAQFNADGDGFIDWIPLWDFNDRVIILPYTLTGSDGFVTEKFSYTLTITGADGSVDTQHGTVDMSKEVVPDLNSFGIDAGDAVRVNMSRAGGTSLWLLQNNPLLTQTGLAVTVLPRKK